MLRTQLLGAESTALTWTSKVTVKWEKRLPKSRTGSEQKHLNNPQETFKGEDLLTSFPFTTTNWMSETSQTGKLKPALSNTCSVTHYNCQTDTQILLTLFRHLSHENMLHPYFTKWVQARGRKQEWSWFPVPKMTPEQGTDKIKNCFARKNRLLWRSEE